MRETNVDTKVGKEGRGEACLSSHFPLAQGGMAG